MRMYRVELEIFSVFFSVLDTFFSYFLLMRASTGAKKTKSKETTFQKKKKSKLSHKVLLPWYVIDSDSMCKLDGIFVKY